MKALVSGSLMLIALALPLTARAANVAVVGGTYGSSCNSGGYFTPAQVTVSSGDTITFSVPANDPYAGGLQIHGFPEGNFTVLPGGSHTTAALTASVSYYGTWPYTGCPKGSGSVTVTQPATPAPAIPAPALSKTTTTSNVTSSKASATPTPTLTPTPSPSAGTTPSASPAAPSSPSSSPAPAAKVVRKSAPSLVLAASTGAVGLVVLIALGAAVFWLRHKVTPPPPPPPPTGPSIM